MTDEGEGRTTDSPASAGGSSAASPWEAFARRPASKVVVDEPAELLGDDDEIPELGDEDEIEAEAEAEADDEDAIDERDLTSPAAPIALRAASRPSLPSVHDLVAESTAAPRLPRPAPSSPPPPLPSAASLTEAPPLPTVVDPAAPVVLAPAASSPGLAGAAAPPASRADEVLAAAAAAYVYVPPIYEVPQGSRAALLHLPLAVFVGALGLGLAVALAAGSLGPFEPLIPIVCGLGVLSGFVHVFASFPTILSPKPATRTLLISSGLAFGFAVVSALFQSAALRRLGSAASQLRAYPEFYCIAASFSAAAYLGAAIVARRALRCLLLLRAPNERVDEVADSRAMLAALSAVGAAVLILAVFLGLGLPLTVALPAFMFMTLVGGAVARTQAVAEGAAYVLAADSNLRARLVPRISLSQHAFVASAFLGSFILAMSIRIGLLKALQVANYGSGAGVSAAVVDRALFVAVPLFTAIATASFWIPRLSLPRIGAAPPLSAPRGSRVALVLAVLSLGMLLRLEDAYERRVASARETLITKDGLAREADAR